MNSQSRPTSRLATIFCLAASLAFLSGCAAAGDNQAANGDTAVYDYATSEQDTSGSSAVALNTERLIARNAVISLVVDDIVQATAQVRTAVADLDGSVMQESLSQAADQPGRGRVVVEVVVPPDRLDEALELIAGLGKVNERRIESVDVTDQVVDVETRVQTMRESIKRLQDLMNQSGSVADIASVEAELTTRQAELESLLARQQSLEQSVAVSPIIIEMATQADALEFQSAGFVGGLKGGWKSLVATGGVAATVLGALIPWLVVAAILAWPVMWLYRRWKRSRPPHPAPPPPVPGWAFSPGVPLAPPLGAPGPYPTAAPPAPPPDQAGAPPPGTAGGSMPSGPSAPPAPPPATSAAPGSDQ